MRAAVLLVALAAVRECPPRPSSEAIDAPPGSAHPASPRQPASAGPWVSSTVIEARSRGIFYGKPPLAEHFFDVVLHNPEAEPRWMVLPQVFPYKGSTEPAPGGFEGELHSYPFSGPPRVLVVMGVSGHFWAVRLPARGRVKLRRLGIESWWETTPPAAEIEVLIARELTLGGAPLGTLLGVETTSETGGDVEINRGIRFPDLWHPDAGSSARIAIDVVSRARISVPLSRALHSP